MDILTHPRPKVQDSQFKSWLLQQCDRDDPVGDLACDARDDPGWKAVPDTHDGIKFYLLWIKHACWQAVEAFHEAWREWAITYGHSTEDVDAALAEAEGSTDDEE